MTQNEYVKLILMKKKKNWEAYLSNERAERDVWQM